MAGSDRPAENDGRPAEPAGPVIHDRRRIDPVTGQVRHGKHAASRPAGTPSASRPGPASEPQGAPASGPRSGDGAAREDAAQRPQPSEPGSSTSEPQGAPASGSRSGDGAAREDAAQRPQPSEAPDPLETVRAELAERTSDLQRLQAEYVNYRKRVERDRVLVKEQAVAATLTGLLPVLDAIDQAREHGELSGGFKSVADSLQAALGRLGLVTYGEKGDAFDPKIHEALAYSYSPDVAEDTCVEILQPGYKVGDKILRAARVAVAAPATGPEGVSVRSEEGEQGDWPSPEDDGEGH